MKIARYSCKCKLCKAKWTTEEKNWEKAYALHAATCPRYSEVFAKRRASIYSQSDAGEHYQMCGFYFQHRQIEGHYVADKPCDGRCMGATGHQCECSCGGKNHGIAA